jgi:hypothetical protein
MTIWIQMRGETRWKLHNHHTWPRERRGVLEYNEEWVRYAPLMLDETMRTNVETWVLALQVSPQWTLGNRADFYKCLDLKMNENAPMQHHKPYLVSHRPAQA